MDVRDATVADVEGIQRVASEAWHAAHAPIAGADRVDAFLDEQYARERLTQHVVDPTKRFLVADDGGVVGFALVTAVEDDPEVFGLGSIYVHPDRWTEGIGTRLLERAERAARERGGSRVRLGVMADNDRAVGFYESRGYEKVDESYDDRLDVVQCTYARDL